MESSSTLSAIIGLILIFLNGFCVAAEYALIGSRKSRLETMAKRGNRSAALAVEAHSQTSKYVAGIQIAISLCGVGIGALFEPVVTGWLSGVFGRAVPLGVSLTISLLIVTYLLVIFGELIPKYLILANSERAILILIRPLRAIVTLLKPFVWFVEKSGGGVMKRVFKIDISDNEEEQVSKDELLVMLRAGASDGQWDESHARIVQKALKFDVLDAADIMVHRMDIQWVDITATREDVRTLLQTNKHSRLVVCREHIDDVVGIIYLQDLIKGWESDTFDLNAFLRPVELVPENLNLNRIIQRMREAKTQLLLVSDEYGGTSGLVTLEDVVEEVFGELDDQPEADRPAIERIGPAKLSIRSDVRYDELLEFLERESDEDEPLTDTVAQIIVERLAKVPKLGDRVDDPLGTFRVENMARRRITRIALQLLVASPGDRDS